MGIHDQIVGTLEGLAVPFIIQRLDRPVLVNTLNATRSSATVIRHVQIPVRTKRCAIWRAAGISE